MVGYLEAGAILALHRPGMPSRYFKSCIEFINWLAGHPCQPIYTKGLLLFYGRLHEAIPEELRKANISIRSSGVMAEINLDYRYKHFSFLGTEGMNMPRALSASDALDYFQTMRDMLGYWPRSVGTASKRLYKGKYSYFNKPDPILSEEEAAFCREAFFGGFNYLRPGVQDVSMGVVYDCNRMYAHILDSKPLPVGKPQPYLGKPQEYSRRFYIHRFRCSFRLRSGALPFIILKDDYLRAGYVNEGTATLTLSKPDFELFQANYIIKDYEPLGGYDFLTCTDAYKDYIEDLNKHILRAKSPGERAAYKILGNALYGAYATKDIKGRTVYEDGIFKPDPDYFKRSRSYIPVSVAIAAYARQMIIELAQRERSNFYYSDTDSLHLHRPSKYIEPTDAMGGFKVEELFTRGRYFGRRKYVLELRDGSIKSVLAGMPYGSDRGMLFDDYQRGKLIPVTIKHLLPNGSLQFDNLFYEL